jgi:UDP-N-acetylglucosamine transferase subunit ALG13
MTAVRSGKMVSDDWDAESPRRAVLAASTGGHLAQMHRLIRDLPIDPDPLWITFDHPQSRSLLQGARVVYVPYIAPRDFKNTFKGMPSVLRALRKEEFDVAISTGAAIANPVLGIARMMGKKAWYIESVSRFDGPSLTGKAMGMFPGISTYTQHQSWADNRWLYKVSVLDKYTTEEIDTQRSIEKIFVTLGTIRPYRFDAMIDTIAEVTSKFPVQPDITWQVGATSRRDLTGKVHELMSADEFKACVLEADLCISHSGVGSAMQVMDLGRAPLLVPRRRERNEHVDDHQQQIARELAERGLAVAAEADEIDIELMLMAANRRIQRVG